MQNRTTGFKISGVFKTNDLSESGATFEKSAEDSSIAVSGPGGSMGF